MVVKTRLTHGLALIHIAEINKYVASHQIAQPRQIQTAVLIPLGHQDHRITALNSLIEIIMVSDAVR